MIGAELLAERLVDLVEHRPGLRKGLGQILAHADGLAALPRKGECALGHDSSREVPNDSLAASPGRLQVARRLKEAGTGVKDRPLRLQATDAHDSVPEMRNMLPLQIIAKRTLRQFWSGIRRPKFRCAHGTRWSKRRNGTARRDVKAMFGTSC